MFKKDIFGNSLWIKRWLIVFFGFITHRRFIGFNKLSIEGSDTLRALPDNGVLFVSNHQTYFSDVTAMLHVFNAALKGRKDNINNIFYIWKPKLNIYFVAAKETMQAGLLPKILGYTGSIPIERTWREKGQDLEQKKQVDTNYTFNIIKAIEAGWVITFPQGTTKAYAPVRKGTAHIILQKRPIVVPIQIDGFRRAFDKKGLFTKKRGVNMTMKIKPPLHIDYNIDTVEDIVNKITKAINQAPHQASSSIQNQR